MAGKSSKKSANVAYKPAVRYFKERGRCLHSDSLAVEWGHCVRFVEIGDDRYAVRQVEVYGDGHVLRYDRSHWCDRFGQLFGCRFSHKQKAIDRRLGAEVIEAKEFERAWRDALGSSMWRQQVEQSLAVEWGIETHWLRESRDGEAGAAADRGRYNGPPRCTGPLAAPAVELGR